MTVLVGVLHKPLWHPEHEIPLIVLSGEFESGKSLFGALIDPEHTFAIDTEGSLKPYRHQLPGITIHDMAEHMRRKFGGAAYKPFQYFQEWKNLVGSLPVNQYRVIMTDHASPVEEGLVDYVRRNPNEFGYTSGQFAAASGLMWGAMKGAWEQVLNDVMTRCETLVLVFHMREKFAGGRPTGEREAKGKETIDQLASLSLELSREPVNGRKPDKPNAKVVKHRLSRIVRDETGSFTVMPLVPPYITECDPAKIRWYLANPPNYAKLKKNEQVPERHLTEDQRLFLQSQIAADMAAAAQAEAVSRETTVMAVNVAAGAMQQAGGDQEQQQAVSKVTQPAEMQGQAQQSDTHCDPDCTGCQPETEFQASAEEMVTTPQIEEMQALLQELQPPPEFWRGTILARFRVNTARDLTSSQADRVLAYLRQQQQTFRTRQELEKLPDRVVQGEAAGEQQQVPIETPPAETVNTPVSDGAPEATDSSALAVNAEAPVDEVPFQVAT